MKPTAIFTTLLESAPAPAHIAWHEFSRAFGIGKDMPEFLEDYMGLTIYSLESFYNTYETPLDLIETHPTKFFKALHDYSDMEYRDIIFRLGDLL